MDPTSSFTLWISAAYLLAAPQCPVLSDSNSTMNRLQIAKQRLMNQHITQARFTEPAKVVEWLGAVQAQDYAGAKWSLGLRSLGVKDGDVERAFVEGTILRTHLLRPTWHFVTPGDIRWLLALTAPRVHQANAYMYRKLGLDASLFKRSNAALEKALRGKQLIREELREQLRIAGVKVEGEFRMSYLLMRAELDGLICSGGRRGNQFTYALLDERVPPSNSLSRDAALAELTCRFFRSRGPATVQDFAKWSGLTIADTRNGLETVQAEFEPKDVEGQTLWSVPLPRSRKKAGSTAHLLSIYDEYISGYKDHGAIVSKEHGEKLKSLGNAVTHIIVIDGQIAGTWKRTLKKGTVEIKSTSFVRLTKAKLRALHLAARRYGEFHELDVNIV